MDMMQFAQIPAKYQAQEVQWLRLSPDSPPENGVFVLLFKELSKPCLYDHWFENVKIAKQWAKVFYGVHEADWKTADELVRRGIQIIDEK